MRNVKEIFAKQIEYAKESHKKYPDIGYDRNDYFSNPCDYHAILAEIGEIVIQVDDQDYQGDSRVLYKKDDYYGWLQFGWGSCSGCDALQGCDSWNEVQSLADSLEQSVKWMTKEECIKFFNEHDWEGDYSWHYEEQRKFIEKVKEYFNALS